MYYYTKWRMCTLLLVSPQSRSWTFPSSQKFPFTPFQSILLPSPAPGSIWSAYIDHCRSVLSFKIFDIKEMEKHLLFCVWLLSLRMVFLRFIFLCGVSVVHSFLLLSSSPLYGCTMVYLPIHELLDTWVVFSFSSLATTNKAVMNTQVAVYSFNSLTSGCSSFVFLMVPFWPVQPLNVDTL